MIKVVGEPIEWGSTKLRKMALDLVPRIYTKAPVTEKLRETVTKIEAASRKRGRPKKQDALSAADRARAYRERKKRA